MISRTLHLPRVTSVRLLALPGRRPGLRRKSQAPPLGTAPTTQDRSHADVFGNGAPACRAQEAGYPWGEGRPARAPTLPNERHGVALRRLLPRLGDTPVELVDAQAVADLVAELHAAELKKQTIRKTVSVLAMVLDHAGVQPNPARDRLIVKMPREERRQVQPPTADHVVCPRDDRHPDCRVFELVTGDRLRTALTRACTAAGVPAFSPHDLRHRRISLMHLAGVPWARIGEQVDHDDITTTSRVYTHVVADEAELDYGELLSANPR